MSKMPKGPRALVYCFGMPWRELRGGVGGLGRLGFGAWAFGGEAWRTKMGLHGAVEEQAAQDMEGRGALGAGALDLERSPGAVRADGKGEGCAHERPGGEAWA